LPQPQTFGLGLALESLFLRCHTDFGLTTDLEIHTIKETDRWHKTGSYCARENEKFESVVLQSYVKSIQLYVVSHSHHFLLPTTFI